MLNYRFLAIVFILIAFCGALGFKRIDIDTDIARSLPTGERILADGLEIFRHHPVHDQIAVDIMINRDDPDTLVECGAFLERKLKESGLFAKIGTDAVGELLPPLALHVARNLPLLFSSEELQNLIPLLAPERIEKRVSEIYAEMSSLEGFGQAEFISVDPLGLKDLVLAKMALLAPSTNARFYRGSLLSGDGRHLLVIAKPFAAGTDTASARLISDLLEETSQELTQAYAADGLQVTVTPVGAYRAALDNERMIRHDVQFALIVSTLAIALLLILSFSRPLIGILSLVPALAGTAAALLIYSFFYPSISIMVLGFGGAIISITVDHGIAYLLFLDLPHETKGKEASHEVKAVGIMALITTITAFLILSKSGFQIFAELGLFAALGVLFSFLFVHTVFPIIFPVVPSGRERPLPLQRFVNRLYKSGRTGAAAATILAFALILFGQPQFHVSLSSMNSVSQATQTAEAIFSEIWGNLGERIFLMNSGESVTAIQQGNDLLLTRIEKDLQSDILAAAFVPSMIFPGEERGLQNLDAWRSFWNSHRAAKTKEALTGAGIAHGFSAEAFAEFFAFFELASAPQPSAVPQKYWELLGISQNKQDPGLIQFITVMPGKNYDAAAFLATHENDTKIFDPAFFTDRLAHLLFSTFTTMLLVIVGSVALLLLIIYLNPSLTILTLLPAAFAYVCTMGTMRLINHSLDIPALMLSIVIFGMGIDYAIFCVRAHQRYRDIAHPSYARIRSSVFLSGISTLIGFGVLCFADHSLLRSIGLTSALGIAFSLAGTFLLLPPLLAFHFSENGKETTRKKAPLFHRIHRRYRTVEAYPRIFAYFKLRLDPMFNDLPRMLEKRTPIKSIIDIGCGYGVPACWCLENFSEARIAAMDPDPERVRIARIAFGERGDAIQGWAPDLPPVTTGSADAVLLLDMLHYVDDGIAASVFRKSFQALAAGGILVTRCTIRPSGSPSWSWRLENLRIKMSGRKAWCRSPEEIAELLTEAGFVLIVNEVSAANPELVWIVGMAKKEAESAA